jgi:hypothetical protein
MEDRQFVRVVVQREGEMFSAQCLEYDIGTQAPDFETLQSRLMAVLRAERNECLRRGLKPFEGIPAAPEYFHAVWERAPQHYAPVPKGKTEKDPNDGFEVQLALCA